jgi:predicted GTPase
LLELVQKHPLGRYVSEGAVFVCNKWDLIEEDPEREKIAEHINGKLKLHWSGLDCMSQVVQLSTLKAIESQNYGVISPQFRMFINSVKTMMFRAIKARLQNECR